MNLNELESICLGIEWQQETANSKYPLHCRIGVAVTTIAEEQLFGQVCYAVSWVEGAHKLKISNIANSCWARHHAEMRARMLFLKLQRKQKWEKGGYQESLYLLRRLTLGHALGMVRPGAALPLEKLNGNDFLNLNSETTRTGGI